MKILENWFNSVATFLGSSEPLWLKILWGFITCLALSTLFIVIWMPLTFGKSPPTSPPSPSKSEPAFETVSKADDEDNKCCPMCSNKTECTRKVSVEHTTIYTTKTTMTVHSSGCNTAEKKTLDPK